MNQDPQPEETATMPVVAPEMPVIPGIPGNLTNPTKDASWNPADYIPKTLIRYPMYEYKTGKQWFLSKTEKIVVDAYLKTNNITEACRTLNAIRSAHGSHKAYDVRSVKRWLQKPHVARHIAEGFMDQGKVNWFDAPKWESWGVDVLQGKIPATQVQVSVWKEYGKSKGWYKDTGPQVMNNTQINFVQSDGRA